MAGKEIYRFLTRDKKDLLKYLHKIKPALLPLFLPSTRRRRKPG